MSDIRGVLAEFELAFGTLKTALLKDDKTPLGNALALQATLEEVTRNKTAHVVFIGDLNNFKEVNTRHTHEGGDAAIARAGHVLQSALAPFVKRGATAFRQSGDEFAVVALKEDAEAIGRAIERVFGEIDVDFNGKGFRIRGAFGQADADTNLSPEDWKERAEAGCRHAKNQGLTIAVWSKELPTAPGSLRRRCPKCHASFSLEASKEGITADDLFCPQCGQKSPSDTTA